MNFNLVKIEKLLKLNSDLIIQFKDHDEILRNIHLSEKFIKDFSINHINFSIEEVIQYYIFSKKSIQVMKILKYKKTIFGWKDFQIQELDRRLCGPFLIVYVNIENKKTGIIFEDWVRPVQIETIEKINNLIFWDNEGEEVLIEEEGIKISNLIAKKNEISLDIK